MFNFEIDVVLNNSSLSQILLTVFSVFKENVTEIKILRDWDYAHAKSFSINEICGINDITNKDTILIQGLYFDKHNCGCMIQKQDNFIKCDFWKSYNDDFPADRGVVCDENKKIYTLAADFVLQTFDNFNIYYAAIGCEMLVVDTNYLLHKIMNSTALAWVVSSTMIHAVPSGFDCKDVGKYKLLFKTELL